jgi:hypothetical protein
MQQPNMLTPVQIPDTFQPLGSTFDRQLLPTVQFDAVPAITPAYEGEALGLSRNDARRLGAPAVHGTEVADAAFDVTGIVDKVKVQMEKEQLGLYAKAAEIAVRNSTVMQRASAAIVEMNRRMYQLIDEAKAKEEDNDSKPATKVKLVTKVTKPKTKKSLFGLAA